LVPMVLAHSHPTPPCRGLRRTRRIGPSGVPVPTVWRCPEGSQSRGDPGRPDGYSSCSLSFFFKPRATAFFGGLSAPHSSHASDNSGHTRPNIGGVAWVQSGSGAHGHDRWARPAPNLSPASAMGTDRGSGILAGSGARGRIWRTSPTAGAAGPTPRGAAGPTPRGAAPTAIAPRALPKAYVSP